MWVEDLPEVAVDIVRNNRLQPGVALVKLASEVTHFADCSCQREKLLHKLDESFCARPSEVDDKIVVHIKSLGNGIGSYET